MNVLGDNIKKNIATLIDASKEVCLEVNAERTKYMLMPCREVKLFATRSSIKKRDSSRCLTKYSNSFVVVVLHSDDGQ
jgi:hypothetical protein